MLVALPQFKEYFALLERYFSTADASMQRMYSTLQGLVQPLGQDVLRTIGPEQPRNEQLNSMGLEGHEIHDGDQLTGTQHPGPRFELRSRVL